MNRSRIAPLNCAAALSMTGFLLAACANRPESIHASYVAYEKYMDLDCQAMASKMVETRAQLTRYSELQNSKANGDAWGVFLLGIPFSKLSGDVEGDVARLKGEVEALDTAEIKKKCGSTADANAASAAQQQPPAAAAPAAGLIPAGSAWIYNFSDRIYTGNDTSVTVRVIRSDDHIVEEQVWAGSGATRAAAMRRDIDARATSFSEYRIGANEDLMEFAPYLLASGGETALQSVTNATGYPTSGSADWITRSSPPVWESVTVPAGTFRALRLEITGTRELPTIAQPIIRKFSIRIWYAPQVKRYVRLEHKTWMSSTPRSDETIELVQFNRSS